jgi:hypothetical protein
MQYGYFDDAHKEYVITTPRRLTPGLIIWNAGVLRADFQYGRRLRLL